MYEMPLQLVICICLVKKLFYEAFASKYSILFLSEIIILSLKIEFCFFIFVYIIPHACALLAPKQQVETCQIRG